MECCLPKPLLYQHEPGWFGTLLDKVDVKAVSLGEKSCVEHQVTVGGGTFGSLAQVFLPADLCSVFFFSSLIFLLFHFPVTWGRAGQRGEAFTEAMSSRWCIPGAGMDGNHHPLQLSSPAIAPQQHPGA